MSTVRTLRIPVEDLCKGQYFLTNSRWYFVAAPPVFGEHGTMVGVLEPMRGEYGEVVTYDREVEITAGDVPPRPFQDDSLERRATAAEMRAKKDAANAARLRGVQARIEGIRAGVNS